MDTTPVVLESHNYVRAAFGMPLWTHDDLFGGVNRSARELYPSVYGDRADDALKMLYAYVHDNHLRRLKVMACAPDILESLHALGVPMAVVSNKRSEVLRREVSHLGWDHYFKSVIGAGDCSEDKPAAGPVKMAVAAMPGVKLTERGWYVGDTETDMIIARNAGLSGVLIHNTSTTTDLVEKYNPLIAVPLLNELHNKILSIKD